jgi:acyl-CoA synthetase (AMP-forming)/AMP-acid ligase II
MNVRDQMRRAALHNADRIAVIDRHRRLTYEEAWRRGVQVANGLAALGLAPNDRVAVLEDNGIEAVDLFAGTTAGGYVRVPLYARNSIEAHVAMTANAKCRALVVSRSYEEAGRAVAAELGLEALLVRDDGYEGWLAEQSDVDPDPTIDEEDLYLVRHTGGTTGLPKGVGYTHRTFLNGLRDWFYSYPSVAPGDVFLHVGPISHGSGYFFTPMWLQGATNLLLDKFDPVDALGFMERERVSFVFLVPTMAAALAREAAKVDGDWSALRMMHISGAPVSDRTVLACREVFGDVLYQMYGQTEAVTGVIMGPREWFSTVPGSTPLRAAGRPFPYGEIKVVGEDGTTPLPPGEEGEIAIRCDGQMSGYLDDPVATAEKIKDGFVLTGDLGQFDANGFLYVLDRKDDMIISGGFNLYPNEIENAIANHPEVLEVAVFGVPDEKWGEAPLAVCAVAPDATVSAEDIIDLCRRSLGSYKKPREVVFTDQPLPKSPTGKLQRKVLREVYWAGEDRRVSGG